MKTNEFENFFFYLTDKCRVLKGKEIAPEQKSTWEIVFAPIAFQDAIAAVNYWIGNETFTPTPAELAAADVHFIAVGTPQSATGGEADLSQLWSVVDMLHDALPEGGRSLVVGKSTVPVGTAQQVAERADITRDTLRKIESGNPNVSFNSVAQVLRALGLLDRVVDAVDPLNSDIGRLRADRLTRRRAR